MMNEQDIALFDDSLDRCMGKPGFFDHFYALFLASSEEVAEKFKDTDFQKQKRVLKASIHIMTLIDDASPEVHAHLERIARIHSRNELNIRPEFYDLWLDCLIQTAKEFDALFTRETEEVWRRVMEPGIKFMRSRY